MLFNFNKPDQILNNDKRYTCTSISTLRHKTLYVLIDILMPKLCRLQLVLGSFQLNPIHYQVQNFNLD